MNETQREDLISLLIESWKDRLSDGCINLDEMLDECLYHGRKGFIEYSDAELIDTALEWALDHRLDELEINYKEIES